MREILQGVKALFWNEAEQRLRAPLRFAAMFGLFLFALSMIELLGVVVGSAIPTSGSGAVYATAILQLGQLAILVGAILAFAWVIDRRRLSDFGLTFDRQWWRDLLFGTLLGGVMAGTAVALAVVSGLATIGGTFVVRDTAFVDTVSVPAGTVLGFLLFVLVAILWEVVFRGYVLVNVAEGLDGVVDEGRTAIVFALVVSSVLFGLINAALPDASAVGILTGTLLGFVLGVAVLCTERLAIPVGLHAAWGVTLGPVFGTTVDGLDSPTALLDVELGEPIVLSGGTFGVEGGLLALVSIALGAGALVWWLRAHDTLAIRETITEPDLWIVDDPDT